MNVNLVITRKFPNKATTIPLPPSEKVNELLHEIATYFEEKQGLILGEIERLAYDGDDIEGLVYTTNKVKGLTELLRQIRAAAEHYDVLLNANPREPAEESA